MYNVHVEEFKYSQHIKISKELEKILLRRQRQCKFLYKMTSYRQSEAAQFGRYAYLLSRYIIRM